jgi:hypothetical protein
MADLPEQLFESKTAAAIYKYYEDNNGDFRRDHLGASLIGTECERALWYSFRWCTAPTFDGRMLRLFRTGSREEDRVINDLRNIGATVYCVDEVTGMQIHHGYIGGHFAGSLDGKVIGIPDAPKTMHVLEVKTTNTKGFNELKKKGVKVAKFLHWCQMQTYMGWEKLDRALYVCVCKEDDRIHIERVHFDKDMFNRINDKAQRIVLADTPGFKICDSESDFRCRFCDHKETCHGIKLPLVNCRTCALITPTEDGKWVCCFKGTNRAIETIDTKKVHPCHVFNPAFVKLPQTDASQEDATITYCTDIVNGKDDIRSTDLQPYVNKFHKVVEPEEAPVVPCNEPVEIANDI